MKKMKFLVSQLYLLTLLAYHSFHHHVMTMMNPKLKSPV